jgi:3-methyladenine DNA glycosylase AlkD
VSLKKIKTELEQLGNPLHAEALQRFFKTGPGEYGEGDLFRGIKMPTLRKLTKKYCGISCEDAEKLLSSKHHEDRMLALLILDEQYRNADAPHKKRIYTVYLKNTRFINNWDIVDVTVHHIVGAYLMDRDKKVLFRLAQSKMLWERRIAVIATFYFIRHGRFYETLKIAEMLLADPHDLIHKAVGWMLREIGKRDLAAEEQFLRKHYHTMPRTMLRYAVERFPEEKRRAYLDGRA